jgi:hypothetical protein
MPSSLHHHLLLLLLHAATTVLSLSLSPPPPAYQLMQRRVVANAVSRGAVCNDGTPAAYYVRNCTANGDRKPGDPDFCLKGERDSVRERERESVCVCV